MHIGERGNRTFGMDPYDLRQREVADLEGMGQPYRPVKAREAKRNPHEAEQDSEEIIRANGDGMILRIPVES